MLMLMPMPMPMISKPQVLAALTTAIHTRHDQGREALAGPIVLHLHWRPPASPVDGPPVSAATGGGRRPAGRDLAAGHGHRPAGRSQPAASTPPRPRSKRHDRPDPDQPPRGRP